MPKISDLTTASVSTDDTIPIVDGGSTKKATLAAVKTAIAAGVSSVDGSTGAVDLSGSYAPLTGSTAYATRRTSFTVGKYYTSPGMGAGAATPTQSRLRVVPFVVDKAQDFDRIGTQCSSSAASTTPRWAIYSDNGAGAPGTLVLDQVGSTNDFATTGFKEATISLSLSAGIYWIGCVAQGGNPSLLSHSGIAGGHIGLSSAEVGSLSGVSIGYYMDSVTGAIPATYTAGGGAGAAPQVWLRAA